MAHRYNCCDDDDVHFHTQLTPANTLFTFNGIFVIKPVKAILGILFSLYH